MLLRSSTQNYIPALNFILYSTSLLTENSMISQFTMTAIRVHFIFRNTVGTVLARIAFTRRLVELTNH